MIQEIIDVSLEIQAQIIELIFGELLLTSMVTDRTATMSFREMKCSIVSKVR